MDGFVHFKCINLKCKLPSIPSFMLYLSVVGKSYPTKHSAKKLSLEKKKVYKILSVLISNLTRIHKQIEYFFIVSIPQKPLVRLERHSFWPVTQVQVAHGHIQPLFKKVANDTFVEKVFIVAQ